MLPLIAIFSTLFLYLPRRHSHVRRPSNSACTYIYVHLITLSVNRVFLYSVEYSNVLVFGFTVHLIHTIRFSWECDSKSGSILFLCRCKQKISHLNAWVNRPSFRKNSMLLFCLLLRKYVLLQIVSSSRKKSDWSNSKRLKNTGLGEKGSKTLLGSKTPLDFKYPFSSFSITLWIIKPPFSSSSRTL